MLDELDRLIRSINIIGREWMALMDQLQLLTVGPDAEIRDAGNHLRLAIRPSDLPAHRFRWTARAEDRKLFLRGTLPGRYAAIRDADRGRSGAGRSRFVQVVPLPADVHPRPADIRIENGSVIVLLKKKGGSKPNNDWRWPTAPGKWRL